MIQQDPTRSLLVLATIAALLTVSVPATADGPLPSIAPVSDGAQATAGNTAASADILTGYAASAGQHADVAVNRVLDGAPAKVVIPFEEANTILRAGAHLDDEQRPQGAVPGVIKLTGASAVAVLDATGIQRDEFGTFGTLVTNAGLRAVGLEMRPGTSAAGVTVATVGVSDGTCTSDPHTAIALADPGDEVLVCPGVYEPFTIDTHFVTVRAEQGPLATVVESQGGDGIQVHAASVTIEGFQVRGATDPGAAAIRVGVDDLALNDRSEGQLFATTVRDNLLRGNTHGVVVADATDTRIEGNVIRSSTSSAVLVLGDDDAATEAVGITVLANDFIANRGLAIENQASTPVIAAANYYGSATGPSVMVQGGCIGLDALFGPATCHNGLGTGVITLGFSPTPLR